MPTDDYIDTQLDLLEHLINHPSATYYIRLKGDSMHGLDINDGDLLIIDNRWSLNRIITLSSSVDGELTS